MQDKEATIPHTHIGLARFKVPLLWKNTLCCMKMDRHVTNFRRVVFCGSLHKDTVGNIFLQSERHRPYQAFEER